MLFINRMVMIGLLSVGIAAATTAQAANQMFTASWYVKAFGNECEVTPNGAAGPGPKCSVYGQGEAESEIYSVWAAPQNIQCNNLWPRCPFNSTPTDGASNFHVLGGYPSTPPAPYCHPWNDPTKFSPGGDTTMRPGKGGTLKNGYKKYPPLYRNYAFFTTTTPNAQPNLTYCNATSTQSGGPGRVMLGSPVTGTWTADVSTMSGFDFSPAPLIGHGGVRVGQGTRSVDNFSGTRSNTLARYPAPVSVGDRGAIADFQNITPYIYSYTYATLRNATGDFDHGHGPGDATIYFGAGDATITIKAGPGRFGGTMRMLGAMTTKVCYFRNKGCSVGDDNWRYEAIGATASTTGAGTPSAPGALLAGYSATYQAYYYHTVLMQKSTVNVEGERFPWTTGSVTVDARGRGPHKTIHFARGYDNRNPTTHKGTIQLVTPVLTRWLQTASNFETGGIGILRIKFVPEPQTWALLIAGVSLLGVGYRMRGR